MMYQDEQITPATSLDVLGLAKGAVSLLVGKRPLKRDHSGQAYGRCDDSGGTIACGIARVASNGLNLPEDVDYFEPRRVRVAMFITDDYAASGGRDCPYHGSLLGTDPRWLMVVENGLPAPVEALARMARAERIGLVIFNPIAGRHAEAVETIYSLRALADRSGAAVLAVLELGDEEFAAVMRAEISSEILKLTKTILIAQPLLPCGDDLDLLNSPSAGWCPARCALLKIDCASRGLVHLANITVDEAGVSFWSPSPHQL